MQRILQIHRSVADGVAYVGKQFPYLRIYGADQAVRRGVGKEVDLTRLPAGRIAENPLFSARVQDDAVLRVVSRRPRLLVVDEEEGLVEIGRASCREGRAK